MNLNTIHLYTIDFQPNAEIFQRWLLLVNDYSTKSVIYVCMLYVLYYSALSFLDLDQRIENLLAESV